jgi:hypothetical protein
MPQVQAWGHLQRHRSNKQAYIAIADRAYVSTPEIENKNDGGHNTGAATDKDGGAFDSQETVTYRSKSIIV